MSIITGLIETSAKNRGLVLFGALALAAGGFAAMENITLDAIPDLSDPQVVVFTEWMGRSPTLVEDQVTYPLVTAFLGAPHVVDVRGQSMFGMSFVYVIFEEGTDLYWARSRVLEQLNTVQARLPPGASPRMGPDATGIGWVYQYALVDRSGGHDLGQLRALQDFSLRFTLSSVPGVAEVAAVGGFAPQYQVTVDPVRLSGFGLSITQVAEAVRGSNQTVGARTIEMSEREHFVRGEGCITSEADIEKIVLAAGAGGTAVTVGDVAKVTMGGDIRRGAADFNGLGETVSGVIVMRQARTRSRRSSASRVKLNEIRKTLPKGVEIIPVYDRSALIERSIDTLEHSLLEEMAVVAIVIILFLLHLRSAMLPIISLPLAVLVAFIPMYFLGIPATIMSVGGIAIAIGATVDAEIVMIEAAHKRLEGAPADMSEAARNHILAEAAAEVTPAIFFSLLIIAASFLPVFGLTGQAGRLFRPLAFTKTFVMLGAALLSITVAPALRSGLLRGKIRSESKHPVSKAIRKVYAPFVHVALHNPKTTVLIGLMALISALPIAGTLGSEFMPPLDEGDILYMPTTFPNISIEQAREQLQRQDMILKSFPEVASVLGKVGRADSPTDPAPLSMVETVVRLKPKEEWREGLTRIELVRQMNERLQLAGWTNAFTQPIRNRVDMLTTGIRTPIGIKVYGAKLPEIEAVGEALEQVLHGVPGTRTVFFDRAEGGLYVDIRPNRDALARYGLRIDDVNTVIEAALGGASVTTTVEGRQRFSVNVRYAEDFRSSVESVRDVKIPLPMAGAGDRSRAREVPLGELAAVSIVEGPPMIRDERGLLVGYVYVDVVESRDIGSYVEDAQKAVALAEASGALVRPSGTELRWTGQYELMAETEKHMKVLIPIALLIVVVLLFLQFKSFTEVLIVILSVPFALVGSIWALHLLDYHVSTAVRVGVIALIGLAAQTGVVMIVYIDNAYAKRLAQGRIQSLEDIIEAHSEGTIQRVRPKLMTVATMLVGLVPLLWATGSGADVMKRIAAPMVGGLVTSAFLTLEIIPVIYTYWRNEQLLWRKLLPVAPRLRARLAWCTLTMKIGAGLAVAAALARLYGVDAAVLWASAVGGAVALVAFVLYLVVRRHAVAALRGSGPPAAPAASASPTGAIGLTT
ncbi:MAG: CusA/CzcA family heavy metal efflux RND transporter [Myxococcota bacterium]